MHALYRRLWLVGLGLVASLTSWAQAPNVPAHTVFLLGNTATDKLPTTQLQALRQVLESQTGPFTVVHLGDIADNTGLAGKQDQERQDQLARVDALLGLVQGLPNGRIYFVPGDKDWANSGPEGLKAVQRLEKYIEEKLPGQNAFMPTGGCPGPEIVDVAPLVRLVAVNTPWFTHPHDRPEAPDTQCKTLTQEEFREQLQDVLDDTKGQNVLVVGHQPVVTNGVYGGHMPLSRHLFPFENGVPLPVFGTVYAAYRQNVGTPRDLANPGYQALRGEMLNTMRDNPGVVYAAAHDYSLQLTRLQDNYHLVSGSFLRAEHVGTNARSQFNEAQEGFSKLDYYADGGVQATFYVFSKDGKTASQAYSNPLFRSACTPATGKDAVPVNAFIPDCPTAVKGVAVPKPDGPVQATVTVTPGPQYKGGPGRRLFIGPVYRSAWTQPVAVPTLDLQAYKGGMRAFGRGGGRQTTSLKLIAADSSEYVFRSVDKDVTKILPPELRQSVAADVLRDVTATAHPYSALITGSLLDQTDILHARPKLFVLPDNQQLGPYREEYAGLLGTLEDRPGDPKPNLPGFGGADEVRRSFSFFRQLYKDHDNQVDAPALAKARAFDMLVADFGKHEDNWKWAAYKQGNKTVYRPIPRDRDQSFTLWNGLLTWTANREWAIPSIEDFQDKFNDMESLNWPARHLDRFLLQSLSRRDWQDAAKYLQTKITPAAIDEATAQLPAELRAKSGQEINRKLKTRIQELPKAIDVFYLDLARRVDVVGSNKAEVFLIDRLPDGNVRVRVFDKDGDSGRTNGEAYFDRTFVRGETTEVSVYGFDGKDVFTVTGQSKHSILVRLIGGDGKDLITDNSQVNGPRTYTKVYDLPDTELQLGTEGENRTSPRLGVNRYNREEFEFDGYAPRATLIYNQSDGIGAGIGFDIVEQGFRKPGYKTKYGIDIQGSSNGNFQVALNSRYRYAIGKFDIGLRTAYGNYFTYYNFFGLGNNTTKDDELYDDNFYKARYKGYTAGAFTERVFLQRSVFRFGAGYEHYTSNFSRSSLLGQLDTATVETDQRPNTAFQRLIGLNGLLDIDLRDRQLFARRGVRLRVQHDTYRQLNRGQDFFGLTQGFAEYYGTAWLLVPVTLVLKAGGAKNYGDSDEIPFYKFTSLGQRENLRGYVRNRFTGDASAYFNTELRLALGQVRNNFLPFYYGVFGFYDQGQVYYKGRAAGGAHAGYGGGFYIAPVVEKLALSVSYQMSEEESGLIQFGLGFIIDQ